MRPRATPGQTVGPFFHFGLCFPGDALLVARAAPGAVRLGGRVLDGAGDPVPDALVELRQAGPDGVVPQRSGSLSRGSAGDVGAFTGWGRCATDAEGRYAFTTLEPGPTTVGAAPLVVLCVLARGLLDRLFTRAYLPAAPEVLGADPLLASLTPRRRRTLMCEPEPGGYRFDIRLQGEDETVFVRYD